jgi:hypothetical protein
MDAVSAAFAALVAALGVIFTLAVSTTTSQPIETYLNVLTEFLRGESLRVLSAEEALSMFFYCAVIYLILFSLSWFVLRIIAIFLVAFGVPDEDAVRLNREVRRGRGAHIDLARRQARLTAAYILRAQQVAAARQRRANAAKSRTGEPTLDDFNL